MISNQRNCSVEYKVENISYKLVFLQFETYFLKKSYCAKVILPLTDLIILSNKA